MKAWFINEVGTSFCFLVHATSSGKAKSKAMTFDYFFYTDIDFTDLRVSRCKALDDKPFTIENAEKVLYFQDDDDTDDDGTYCGEEACRREYWVNHCDCEICKSQKGKV